MTNLELYKKQTNEIGVTPKKVPPRFPFQNHETVIAFEFYYPKHDRAYYACFREDGKLLAQSTGQKGEKTVR